MKLKKYDIEELERRNRHLSEAYENLSKLYSSAIGKISVARLALKHLEGQHEIARIALEELNR